MLIQKLLLIAGVGTLAAQAHPAHAGGDFMRPRANNGAPPTAFDGQWMTNPVPGPGNQAVEWWWFQILGNADPVTGIVPSVEAIFYLGFTFTRGPNDPSYQVDVSGVFPNGTAFFVSSPVTTKPTIVTHGQDVIGEWGTNAKFGLHDDSNNLLLEFNNAGGVNGQICIVRDKTPAHVPCGTTTQGSPYFDSLAQGLTLNDAETALFTEIGWAIEMPRGKANVNLNIQGTPFTLSQGVGYHDHNWSPITLDKFAYTWILGLGSCGPFDIGYVEVQAMNSTRSHDLVQSSLAYNGEFLQSECHVYGSQNLPTVRIDFVGQTVDPASGQNVPTGFNIEYTLKNGTVYQFSLTNSVENPSFPIYRRWRMSGSGGMVGGPQYKCLVVGDWLNPGLATYTEGQSIFGSG